MENLKPIESNIEIEGLSEQEAKEFKTLLTKFINSYSRKNKNISDREWLEIKYLEEIPNLAEEEAEKLSNNTVGAINEYEENLFLLNEACAKGKNKEQWFADKIAEASKGVSVIDYGNYLNGVDTAISTANAQMLRTVTTNAGEVSQCYNLDGFIAEQYHVNQFNIRAALRKSSFRAEVCVPDAGKTYALNSFDSVIKDTTTGKIIHQYQFKYGADADATIKMIRAGNYNNQRIIVPIEQVETVQKAFPNKSIVSYYGGTDKVDIKTDGLTKQKAKQLQLDTQQKNVLPTNDWNEFTTKELALNLGRNVGMAGLQSALMTTGFSLAAKVLSKESIESNETVELALSTGADSGIKAATAGAIKVGMEKGIIGIIPKGTPIGIIANIACVGIENIKILYKVTTGELTITQALDRMGRTTTSMVYGIGWGAAGMGIGVAALSWIPIVGPVIGGLTGGMVGYMAGSKFGGVIYSGLKTVGTVIKNTVKSTWNGIKSVGNKLKNFLFG